jgi:hypothetical protein
VKNVAFLSSEWLTGYGTQLVVIVALLKLVTGLVNGPEAFLAEIRGWASHFADYFFAPDFLVALTLVFLIWILGGYFAELLDEMGLEQALILQDTISAASDQPPARERLLGLVFSLCTFLVFITGLLRVNLRAILSGASGETLFFNLPPLAGGGASTLVYFMLGLALLSQTQFMNLNTRWSLARIPVSEKMAGRWALYSLAFLVILAAVASLLPTSYSLGLIAALGYLFSLIFFVVQLLISLFILLISLPFLLFGQPPPVTNPVRPQVPFVPKVLEQTAVGAPLAWLELLKSVAFWALLVGILAFAIIQYSRQHRELLRQFPGWGFLSKAWAWLRDLFTGVKAGLSQAVESGLERLRARRGAGSFFIWIFEFKTTGPAPAGLLLLPGPPPPQRGKRTTPHIVPDPRRIRRHPRPRPARRRTRY